MTKSASIALWFFVLVQAVGAGAILWPSASTQVLAHMHGYEAVRLCDCKREIFIYRRPDGSFVTSRGIEMASDMGACPR